MEIIYSEIFKNIPELIFGFSTINGLDRIAPFNFNLSLNVGDDEEKVIQNRDAFFNKIGLNSNQVAFQKQVHGDTIRFVEMPGLLDESDALITNKKGIGLAVSTADCTPIFIYDKENKIISAVHSGWRGTQKEILKKTLIILANHFDSKPENLFCFVAPSISQKNYEVGEEVAAQFASKYLLNKKGDSGSSGIYLDVRKANIDMLLEFGIPENQIEVSPLCSFEQKDLLHSFRREGKLSGRSLGVIALADKNVQR